MKINTATKLLFLALLCAFSFSACTKSEPELKISLAGSWTETPQQAGYNRELYFSTDNSFTMHYTSLSQTVYASTVKGTYQINADKLIVTIKELVLNEANKPPIITAVDQVLFEQAKFRVNGNVLELDFITYPADAPVPTHLTFLKN